VLPREGKLSRAERVTDGAASALSAWSRRPIRRSLRDCRLSLVETPAKVALRSSPAKAGDHFSPAFKAVRALGRREMVPGLRRGRALRPAIETCVSRSRRIAEVSRGEGREQSTDRT